MATLYKWATEDGEWEVLGEPDDYYVEYAPRRLNGALDPAYAVDSSQVAWPAVEELLRLAAQHKRLASAFRSAIRFVPEEVKANYASDVLEGAP